MFSACFYGMIVVTPLPFRSWTMGGLTCSSTIPDFLLAPRLPVPLGNWRRVCKVSRLSGPLLASLLMSPSFLRDGPSALSASEMRDLNEAIDDEEKAQRIFVRYGEGNHFSGDPFHECTNTRPEFRSF